MMLKIQKVNTPFQKMHNENIFKKNPEFILAEEFSLSAVSNIRSSM